MKAKSNQRLTIEEMQQIARDRGGLCLSSTYVNTSTRLRWQCAQQHQWDAVAKSVKHGTWCKICAHAKACLPLESMQSLALGRGGKLLSTVYATDTLKLHWQCARGHTWLAYGRDVKLGVWCRQCHDDNRRHTIEMMQEIASAKGGRCLSTTYTRGGDYLQWQCAAGHTWTANATTIRVSWCMACAFDRKRLGLDKMHELAAMRGGQCLAQTYKNNSTKIPWRCQAGHVWEAAPTHIRRGQWCRECFQIQVEQRRRQRKKKATILMPNLL